MLAEYGAAMPERVAANASNYALNFSSFSGGNAATAFSSSSTLMAVFISQIRVLGNARYSAAFSLRAGASFSGTRFLSSGFRYWPV